MESEEATRLLEAIARRRDVLLKLEEEIDRVRHARNRNILSAYKNGISAQHIAVFAGVTRDAIYRAIRSEQGAGE